MVLTIVILLLLCLIAYLLLMPMELCIDSYRNRYFLRLGFLAKASLEKDPLEILRLHLKVLFLHFYWRPSDLRALGKGVKTRKDKPKKRRPLKLSLEQGRRLLRSFRVTAFRMEVDTGDPVLNAQLYPLFFHIRQSSGGVEINFRDRNYLLLQIVNRPIYIINAFINT